MITNEVDFTFILLLNIQEQEVAEEASHRDKQVAYGEGNDCCHEESAFILEIVLCVVISEHLSHRLQQSEVQEEQLHGQDEEENTVQQHNICVLLHKYHSAHANGNHDPQGHHDSSHREFTLNSFVV